MSFLAAVGIGTSLIGGIMGERNGRRAEREQRNWINRSLDANDEQRRVTEEGFDSARPYMLELLEISRDAANDNLGQVDPVTAAEVRRQRRERQEAEALMSQQMQQRGLDSSTVRAGAQASIAGAAMDARSELGARMAAQRMAALQAGRSQQAAGLGAAANFEMGRASAVGSVLGQRAQILGGVQVQAPNTAAGIGGLGRSMMDMYQTSVLQDALSRATPGPSGVRGAMTSPAFRDYLFD